MQIVSTQKPVFVGDLRPLALPRVFHCSSMLALQTDSELRNFICCTGSLRRVLGYEEQMSERSVPYCSNNWSLNHNADIPLHIGSRADVTNYPSLLLLGSTGNSRPPESRMEPKPTLDIRLCSWNIRYDCQPDNITVAQTIASLPDPLLEPSSYYADPKERPWSLRRIHIAGELLQQGVNLVGSCLPFTDSVSSIIYIFCR
jgi:hypothetical protein